LSKLLFDLYQEGLTPPQVNHVQCNRLFDLGRALRSTSRSVRYSDPRTRCTDQPCRSTFLRLLARTGQVRHPARCSPPLQDEASRREGQRAGYTPSPVLVGCCAQAAKETVSHRGRLIQAASTTSSARPAPSPRLDWLLDQLDLGRRLEAVSNPRTKDCRAAVVVVR
jgi:hypothetical protein